MEEVIEQNEKSDNEQINNENEENNYGQVMTSSTCHNFTCYNQEEDESNKENKLFKNKSESDLVFDKNKLNKIYLPAEDTMDLEQSFKESTGKKYSSSWFYGDSSKNPYPTIEEQVKLCRKIASQLVDDENRKSKGASMFFKRVKRSQKWVHEGFGTKDNNNSSTNSSQTADEEVEKLKRNLKLEAMPKLKLVLDPRELLSLEKLRKTGDIVEHNIVSPDVCHNLVKDLNSPEINKGAAIFLKRKEKSSEWVVDENSTVVKIREQKREQELKKREEENVQKEWLMKKQKEFETVESDFKNNFNQELRELKNELNFDLNASQQFNQQTTKPQQINSITKYNSNLSSSKPISKFEDNCQNVSQTNQSVKHNLQQNQFLKLNFKNFNKVTRPWGITSDEYEKQLKKIQEEQDYKINLTTYPTDKSVNQSIFDQTIKQNSNNVISNISQQPILQQQPIQQQPILQQPIQQQPIQQQPIQQQPIQQQPIQQQPIQQQQQSIQQQQILQKSYPLQNNNRTQNTNLAYQTQNQLTKSIYPHYQLDYKKQINPKIKNQNSHLNLHQTNNNPLSNSQQTNQNAYKNQFHNNTNIDKLEYSPFKNVTHYNSSTNFNNYIFNKLSNQQPNFADMIKNENHNSYFNQPSSIYSNTNYNQSNNQFNNSNQQYDNPIKNFDLTKLQIPSNSMPKFKDFNAKPKLFMRC